MYMKTYNYFVLLLESYVSKSSFKFDIEKDLHMEHLNVDARTGLLRTKPASHKVLFLKNDLYFARSYQV